MSPEDFCNKAKVHRNEIRDAWKVVSKGCAVFERDAIWPDQCDHARRSILTLNEPVQEFCAFLGANSVAVLPHDVIPARYTLLKALHRINQAVDELVLLLTGFRTICGSPSYETVLQKHKIQCKLYDIEQDKEAIQFTLDRLLFPLNIEVS